MLQRKSRVVKFTVYMYVVYFYGMYRYVVFLHVLGYKRQYAIYGALQTRINIFLNSIFSWIK